MGVPTSITVELDWAKLLGQFTMYNGEGEPLTEPTTPEQVLIVAAAREIALDFQRNHGDVYSSIAREVRAMRTTIIREKIEAQVEQALDGTVQRTNTFGDAVGEPTTLRQLVIDEAQSLLANTSRRNDTLLERLIAKETEAAIKRELSEALTEVKRNLSSIITARAAHVLGDALVEAVGSTADLTAKAGASVARESARGPGF